MSTPAVTPDQSTLTGTALPSSEAIARAEAKIAELEKSKAAEPAEETPEEPAAAAEPAEAEAESSEEQEQEPEEKPRQLTSRDWAAFKAQKKALREREAKFKSEIETEARKLHETFSPLLKAKELWDEGDLAGALKQAFDIDPSEFNKRLIQQAKGADPKLTKLERALQETERKLREREEREAQEATRQKQEAERNAYKNSLGGLIRDLKHDLSPLADDPEFVEAVLNVQERHFDGEETVSVEEALEELKPRLVRMHNMLAKVFGGSGSRNPETEQGGKKFPGTERAGKQPEGKAKPKGPPKTLSTQQAQETAPDTPLNLSRDEWIKKWSNHPGLLKDAAE